MLGLGFVGDLCLFGVSACVLRVWAGCLFASLCFSATCLRRVLLFVACVVGCGFGLGFILCVTLLLVWFELVVLFLLVVC